MTVPLILRLRRQCAIAINFSMTTGSHPPTLFPFVKIADRKLFFSVPNWSYDPSGTNEAREEEVNSLPSKEHMAHNPLECLIQSLKKCCKLCATVTEKNILGGQETRRKIKGSRSWSWCWNLRRTETQHAENRWRKEIDPRERKTYVSKWSVGKEARWCCVLCQTGGGTMAPGVIRLILLVASPEIMCWT